LGFLKIGFFAILRYSAIESDALMLKHNKFMILAPLFLVLVIDTMGAGIIFPILGPLFMTPSESILPLATSENMRQFWYGATLTSWALLMFIGAPFLGDLSDRIGRKKVLVLCLVGDALGFVLSGIGIQSALVSLVIIGRLVSGFFSGSQSIAQAVIADISSAKDKIHNMSWIIFANCVGFIIGPIAGGYLADAGVVSWFTYSTPFYVAGVLALLNGFMLLYTLVESYQPDNKAPINFVKGLLVFTDAFTNKKVRWHSVALFLIEFTWTIFFVYAPIFVLQMYHYDNLKIAQYMSYLGVLFAISLTVGIKLFTRYLSLTAIVNVNMIAMGLGLILMATGDSEWQFWVYSIPVAVACSVAYSVLITMCSNRVSHDEQGWVMGVIGAVVAAAFSVGAIAASLLAAVNIYLPFIFAGVLSMLCVVVMKYAEHSKVE
jgi:MFS transporter, DHA1 family, tetracycline resistance protein